MLPGVSKPSSTLSSGNTGFGYNIQQNPNSALLNFNIFCHTQEMKHTTILQPFFQDHPDEPVPE